MCTHVTLHWGFVMNTVGDLMTCTPKCFKCLRATFNYLLISDYCGTSCQVFTSSATRKYSILKLFGGQRVWALGGILCLYWTISTVCLHLIASYVVTVSSLGQSLNHLEGFWVTHLQKEVSVVCVCTHVCMYIHSSMQRLYSLFPLATYPTVVNLYG